MRERLIQEVETGSGRKPKVLWLQLFQFLFLLSNRTIECHSHIVRVNNKQQHQCVCVYHLKLKIFSVIQNNKYYNYQTKKIGLIIIVFPTRTHTHSRMRTNALIMSSHMCRLLQNLLSNHRNPPFPLQGFYLTSCDANPVTVVFLWKFYHVFTGSNGGKKLSFPVDEGTSIFSEASMGRSAGGGGATTGNDLARSRWMKESRTDSRCNHFLSAPAGGSNPLITSAKWC